MDTTNTPTPESNVFPSHPSQAPNILTVRASVVRDLEGRLAAANATIARLADEIEAMRGGEALEISEGIAGAWFYHLSRGPRQTHSICGARVMTTKIPLSAWGRVSHLNERYCVKCAKHLPTHGALT